MTDLALHALFAPRPPVVESLAARFPGSSSIAALWSGERPRIRTLLEAAEPGGPVGGRETSAQEIPPSEPEAIIDAEALAAAVASARAETEQTVRAELAATIEAAVAEAVAAGREAAFMEGQASRDAEVQDAMQRAIEAAAQFDAGATALRAEARHDAVELAFALAEAVVQTTLTRDRSIVEGLVDAALDDAPAGANLVVRCHPEDHALVVTRLAERRDTGAVASFEVIATPGLERGGLTVTLPEGQLEARPKHHLATLIAAVKARLEVA